MPDAPARLSFALRGLGSARPSLISRASEAADSGLWLALRVDDGVHPRRLAELLSLWQDWHLLPITSVAATESCVRALASWSERVTFLTQWTPAQGHSDLTPLVPAASRDAERFCEAFRGAALAIDESVPSDFPGACFAARAEREKSFVRSAKAAFRGVSEGRIDKVSLWTESQRVLGACRSAARTAHLAAATDYEFCVPHSRRSVANRLLREGETVRVWFAIDESILRRAVAR